MLPSGTRCAAEKSEAALVTDASLASYFALFLGLVLYLLGALEVHDDLRQCRFLFFLFMCVLSGCFYPLYPGLSVLGNDWSHALSLVISFYFPLLS